MEYLNGTPRISRNNQAAIDRLADSASRMFHSSWPETHLSLPAYKRDRLTVCYHEAGHAVLCRLIKLSHAGVVVDNAEEGVETPGGKVLVKPVDPSAITAAVIPDVIMRLAAVRIAAQYLAGYQAELIHHGVELSGCLLLKGNRDYENAGTVLLDTYGHDLGLYYVQKLAHAILVTFWQYVEAVAHELFLRGALTAKDCERLLDDIEPLPLGIFFVEEAPLLQICKH